jgi:hypothetical protein
MIIPFTISNHTIVLEESDLFNNWVRIAVIPYGSVMDYCQMLESGEATGLV